MAQEWHSHSLSLSWYDKIGAELVTHTQKSLNFLLTSLSPPHTFNFQIPVLLIVELRLNLYNSYKNSGFTIFFRCSIFPETYCTLSNNKATNEILRKKRWTEIKYKKSAMKVRSTNPCNRLETKGLQKKKPHDRRNSRRRINQRGKSDRERWEGAWKEWEKVGERKRLFPK